MTYQIIQVREHCELYINGSFYCSTDNWDEAEREVEHYQNKGDVAYET